MHFEEIRTNKRAMVWALMGGLAMTGAASAADTGKMDMAKPTAAKPDSAKPTPAKPDPKATAAATKAVQAAIAILQKEVIAHQKDPQSALRDKCNYFTDNPSTDLLPEVIVQALGSTISPDAPSDSYIKWQLLSGAPAKFDAETGRLAATMLMKAAKPILRPGASANDKRLLDPLVRDVKNVDDSLAMTKKLEGLVTPWEERNKPVLAYRDELYSRLPVGPEALVAHLEDVTQRVEAGYTGEKIMAEAAAEITKWIDTNPPAAHLYVMAERVKKVIAKGGGKPAPTNGGNNTPGGKGMKGYGPNNPPANYAAGGAMQYPPKYYDHVEFDSKYNKWMWADISGRYVRAETLTDLLNTLEDSAKTAKAADGTMTKGK